MKWDAKEVGKIKGQKVVQYTLESKSGTIIKVLNYGATVTDIIIKDKFQKFQNVIVNYRDIADYENSKNCLGAVSGGIVKNFDNIKNKDKVEEKNSLKCNEYNFSKSFWEGTIVEGQSRIALCMKLLVHDVKGGAPRNVLVKVNYVLTCDDEFIIDVYASSDREELTNITNNIFFNLNGEEDLGSRYQYLNLDGKEIYELKEDGFLSGIDKNEIKPLEEFNYWILNENKNSNFGITLSDKTNFRAVSIVTSEDALQIVTLKNETKENLKNNGICFTPQSLSICSNDILKTDSLIKYKVYNKTTKFKFYIK